MGRLFACSQSKRLVLTFCRRRSKSTLSSGESRGTNVLDTNRSYQTHTLVALQLCFLFTSVFVSCDLSTLSHSHPPLFISVVVT